MARKTERVNYEVDMKMNAEQANKALSDVVSHLEHITKTLKASTASTDKYMSSIADMLNAQNSLLQTQLSKLNRVGEKTKTNTEQVKKQSEYQKELSNIINERSKLEEELNGKKLKSLKALKALATRYENQLKRADQARAVSVQNRSEQEKKWFLDKKKYAELEVKLLNTKLDLKKAEALETERLNTLQQKAYEVEKLRLQVEGARKAAASKPPTTATTQKAELDTLKKLAELEKRTHGETLEYYKLQKKAIERERDLKKTLAMDEKKDIHDRINLERAEAKKVEQTSAAKRLSLLTNIKQSDVLKEDLKVMGAELKVLESMKNANHTLLEQERLRTQIHKKQVTLQKTLVSEQKALDDSSLAGTLKHAAQVAPVYMMVAQGVNLLQQAISSTVQAALEFDNTMRVLSAVTGENIERTHDLTEGVMLLGEAYGGSLADYAETAKELSRAGIDTDELVKATEVTAQLGLITGDTIQSASNAIISYSQVYQKAGGKIVYTTQELGDKLAYMANASRLSTEDIGTLSNYALASSKSIGLTVDAVNALAVSFSNAGNNASTIGTQIRRFTSTLTSNSTSVKEFYASIGVNRQDFMAKLLKSKSGDISDIEASNRAFEEFVRNVQSLSENEYRSAIQGMNILDNQFFNQLRNNGDEIVAHLKKSFSDLNGELDKTAVVADGVAKRWERMGNRIVNANESWVGTVGSAVTQLSEDLMNASADLGDTINQWFSDDNIDAVLDKMKEARDVLSRNTHTVDFSTDEEAVKYAQIAKQVAEKQLALQTQIKDMKREGKEVDTQTLAESKKLTAEMHAYDNIVKLLLANQGKKSDELIEKIATIKVRLKAQLVTSKALLDVETKRVAKLKLIKEINEQRGAKKAVEYFEGLGDKSEYEKVKLQIARDIVEEKEKLIQKYIKQANLTQEEIRQLKVSKEAKKSINEETLLSNRLTKDEIQSLETLGRALKNTYDQRQLAVGLQAIQAGIDRNTQANAKYMTSLIASENRVKRLGLELDLNKANVGSVHLQQLIEEKNWLEAVSTIQIAQQLILQEKGRLKELQVEKEKELLGLSGEQLDKAKKDIQDLETKQQALNGIENQLTMQSGILSENLQITNSMTSAFKNMDTAISNQLIPLREVTKELERQHKIKVASAGLDKDIAIANSRKEALASYGTRVDSLYAKAKSQAEITALNREVMKDVRKINDYYNNLDLQAKQELNRKKEQLERELQKSLIVVGKSGLAAKKSLYNKERNEKIALAKKLYTDEVSLKRKIADINKVYNDKIAKSVASANKKNTASSKKYYKAVKDEFKIKSQLLELEVLQAKLSGKYNKLEVLKKELKLLKEQSTAGLKDFELNKHKIDILNKQLEIQKEQKKLKEEQHNIELSIIQENSKKQLEVDTKRAEAERLYQDLLGNKAYAENIRYWELKNKLQEGGINLSIEQIKILEKQREAQEALTNATKSWVAALVGGVLAGEDLGDALHNAMEGLNESITDNFSKSITDSIMESIKTGKITDFGIFDDNGNLTSVGKQGAMALGNLFVKSAFGDNKNAQRGAEFGQAIGFALGGFTGAIGGQIGGAIIGSMMGGKVSYYTRVNEDGTVEAHKRKSGGLFHSSSDKILESETRQLQMAFDQTVKTYEGLLENLFKINDKIEVLAGKYNTGDLLNKVVPQDVIDSWTGATLTQSQIDHLKKLIAERDRVVSHFNSADFTYDYTDVERARQAVKDYAKKIGVALTTDVIEQLRGNTLDLTELQQEARKKSDEIKKAWEAYAELKDKSFNEVFIESLQQLQQTSINVFETLYRDDKVKVLEERAKRYKKAFEDVHKTIYGDLYDGKSDRRQYMPTNKMPNQVTLENYDIMRERAIGKGATPEQVEAWNRLGQILIEDAKNADALKDAIDAKKKAEEEFKRSIATSVRSFEDWVGTFNKSDLDQALYNRARAEEDYKKVLEEVGLESATTKDILELLSSANKDNLENYQHLADAYRNNQEALQSYQDLLDKVEEERLEGLKKEREEILKTRDAIRSSMESIINAQISSIKADISNRTSSISSLQNSMSNYKPAQTVYSHDIYSAIGNWSYDTNEAIENSIKTWHDQQIKALEDADALAREQWGETKNRLQEEENLRVEAENARIDSLNEQIKLNNQLADTINSMKDSVTKTFNDLYGDSTTLKTSLYDALNSGKYSDVSSLFSSYAKKVQDSNLTDTEAYIKIAKANRDIQNVVAPKKKDELEHIKAKTIQIADYTSTLTEDSKKINEATVTMYEALIKQNEDNLPNLEEEVKKIFEQNKKYFDKDSDFYKFLERGATELTYTEKMEEQKKLWENYQKEAREFNNKKLGTLEKIDLSFNKYASSNLARVNNNTNDIKKLEAKLDKLHKEQQKANKINKQIVNNLEKQLQEQKNINRNTKKSVIEVE